MNLAVIRLMLHSTVFGIFRSNKPLGRLKGASEESRSRVALGRADELPALIDPEIFWLNDRLAWELPAMKFESN